jgi:DNA replication licensing factor MCM4
MKAAFFRCVSCRAEVMVEVDRGQIAEPLICASCQQRKTMQLVHNRSTFADKQSIKVQETPDDIPDGETPYTLTVFGK